MSQERRINVLDVQVNGADIVLPCGSKIVASYNWSTTSTFESPRMIVPGSAPIYLPPGSGTSRDTRPTARQARKRNYVAPPRRGFTVAKDVVFPVVDQMGLPLQRHHSVDPLFHSLSVCSPGFDMDIVDIVTDRTNLRKLLVFCNHRTTRTTVRKQTEYGDEPFTFFVHPIGDDRDGGPTLVFTRVLTGQEVPYKGYKNNFVRKLTKIDTRCPPDTDEFHVVSKMSLDGINLLVQSTVDARESVGSTTHEWLNAEDDLSEHLKTNVILSNGKSKDIAATRISLMQPKVVNSTPSAKAFSSSGSGTSRVTSTKSGELPGDDWQLLDLKSKNQRYSHEIDWMDYYWQMVLGGTHKLILGLHLEGNYDRVQQLPIKEVKSRAERAGSSSMVYLANTLREVLKAAHCLLAQKSSSLAGDDEEGDRGALVVEHSPTNIKDRGVLVVRLAVPADGAVSPRI